MSDIYPNRKYAKHKVYNMSFHIVWVSKYRKKILVYPVDDYLKKIINDKSTDFEVSIEEIEVMPDHVHLFVKTSTLINISKYIGTLKGYTSYVLRKKFINLKKYKSL